MSLEKLLIFGFAIAAMGAVATLATSTVGDRRTSEGTYENRVTDLVDLTK